MWGTSTVLAFGDSMAARVETEQAAGGILTDREHIVRWAWTTHDKPATRVAALLEERPELVVVRLISRSDIERWLAGPLQRTVPHR
jgi:hypothetical protein